MSKVLQRRTALLAVMIASLVFVTTALAQMPTSPWKKGAPFPEADEELYGVPANGKLYVFGGWGEGKARGVAYEYDPATDRWTKKTPMPRPAHHAALAAANGKIYVIGGFVAPQNTAVPVGGAWEPIDNAWEYDPAADSWKSLPPLPGKRGSAVAAEVGGKIYVIGGATTTEGSKDPFFAFFGPSQVLGTNDVYDPATNKWESRKPMSVPRNHAFGGVVNGKIYVIGGRTGHGFILSATNTDVVEEYNPINDSWSVPKERMPTARSGGASGFGRPPDLCRRRRGDDQGSRRCVQECRGVRAGDQFVDHAALDADAASRRRGRGDRQSLSPGERHGPVRRHAGVSRPEARHPHGDARHSGAAVRGDSSHGCEERGGDAFPDKRWRCFDLERQRGGDQRDGGVFGRSEEDLRALQRQQPARPGDAREVRTGDRDHAGAAATRSAFMAVVVEYSLAQRLSGLPLGSLEEAQNGSDRITSAGGSRGCGGGVERLPVPRLPTPPTLSTFNSGTFCPGTD